MDRSHPPPAVGVSMGQAAVANILAYQPAVAGSGTSGATADPNATDPAVKAFMDYMKETPAQRWEEEWLRAHGLTLKQLQAMSPAQRAAIEREIARDIQTRLQQAGEKKLAALTLG